MRLSMPQRRTCEAAAGPAWEAFKAAIHLKYPGSDGTHVYTIRDLDDVAVMRTRVLSTTKHLKTMKVQGHTFSSLRM